MRQPSVNRSQFIRLGVASVHLLFELALVAIAILPLLLRCSLTNLRSGNPSGLAIVVTSTLDPFFEMSQVDFAVDHGQDPKAARANFEHTIATAQTRFAKWVRQVNWSEDRSSVAMAGPGFDIVLTYDEQKVYVRGTVPVAFKLMEGPIKLFIAQALADRS